LRQEALGLFALSPAVIDDAVDGLEALVVWACPTEWPFQHPALHGDGFRITQLTDQDDIGSSRIADDAFRKLGMWVQLA